MENTLAFAQLQDQQDSLAPYRAEFLFPQTAENEPVVYLCGNSLGLQPKGAEKALKVELEDWAKFGVDGHFQGRKPWFHYHKFLTDYAAEVVGAQPIEVVVMNQLTVNLHLLFASFYRPNGPRYKIIMEAGAFPSDMYAVESQVIQFGYSYDDAVIELAPRPGEHSLRNEDILEALEEHKNEIALVFFSGVQYYTGQYFDIPSITQKAHEIGALAGFDLAHAAGNIDLQLHQWGVDFAAWCSYKYLNSGPGNVSGIFVHETHGLDPSTFRLAGWWGHKEDVRFQMKRGYIPEPGAAGWQLSNAPVFGMAVHLSSLELFHQAGMANLREKSKRLTSFLEFCIQDAMNQNADLQLRLITPESRGAQLSLLSDENGKAVFEHLEKQGIIADWREPNVIRMAPVPMYNSFEDVYKVGQALKSFRKS